MKSWRIFLALALLLRTASAGDDFFDTLDDHLKFNAFNGAVAGRLSGTFDLEEYYIQQPPPGLIYTEHNFLTNPRLTLNLDLQLGPQVYLFAQTRIDRGYDPADDGAQVQAEQYALRYTPWEDGRVNLQVGKFATVVGNWARRHDSWENPFVTPPLVYSNLTSIWGTSAATSGNTLTSWLTADRDLQLPIVWDANYTTGLAVFGTIGQFDYAAEIKNAALASDPEAWSAVNVGFAHPTTSGRLGWRPNEAWNLGVSSSVGSYLLPEAAGTLAPGKGLGDYLQITLAQDASFAWHKWQLWAECYESRFQVPTVGNADTVAYYVEGKYKFTPELSGALRWNQELFNSLSNGAGGNTAWGANIWSIDAAATYRFSAHLQGKLQYTFQDRGAPVASKQSIVAGQITLRF